MDKDSKEREIYRALVPEEEEKEYPCIWFNFRCPIRTRWKLTPESLALWCPICRAVGYLDQEKEREERGDRET